MANKDYWGPTNAAFQEIYWRVIDHHQLSDEEIAVLDESVADLDVDADCYQSWRPRG